MKAEPVPTDLAQHLAKHWPTRRIAADHIVLRVDEVRPAPAWLVERIETDLRARLAVNLMRERWIMISMAAPCWYVRPAGLTPVNPQDHDEAEFAWNPAEPDKLDALDKDAIVVCRMTGHAVPSFLEPADW